MCESGRSKKVDLTLKLRLAFLNAGNDMTAMVWLRALGLPLSIAATCGLENTQGKGRSNITRAHVGP